MEITGGDILATFGVQWPGALIAESPKLKSEIVTESLLRARQYFGLNYMGAELRNEICFKA